MGCLDNNFVIGAFCQRLSEIAKRVFIIISLFLLSLSIQVAFSQTFQVHRIECSKMDISAQTLSRLDFNGEKCALIRVHLPVENVLFEGSIVGDVAFKTNHYLLYMPYTAKRVKVSCPGVHSVMIEFADYDTRLERGSTYDIYCEISNNQNDGDNGVGKNNSLISYKAETGYGFKDIKGNIVVPPIYKEVLDYRDGIAWVQNDKSLWGSVNEKGEIVVDHKYNGLTIIGPEKYEENICIAGWKTDKKGEYAEVIDYKTGRLLNDKHFKDIIIYARDVLIHDDLPFICCNTIKGKTVCIDKRSGSDIFELPKNKHFVDYVYPNYIITCDRDKYGFGTRYGIYDSHGNEIIKCNNSQITKLKGEFRHIIAVYPNQYHEYKMSAFLYDLKLKRQIGGNYESFYTDSEAHKWGYPLIVTTIYNGYGYCRSGLLNLITGEDIIIPDYNCPYSNIYLPKTPEGLVIAKRVKNESIYDFLDMTGKIYNTVESEDLLPFINGYSQFKKDGMFGIINSKGEVVVPAQYDYVGTFHRNEYGRLQCKVKTNGETYLIDTNGNKILFE